MTIFKLFIVLLWKLVSSKILNSVNPGQLPIGYTEIFFDHFETLNTSIWNVESGNGQGIDGQCVAEDGCPNLPGFGNWEIEVYSPQNVLISDNNLVLFSSFNKTTGIWNSGRINSMRKFSFTYGLVEARLRISKAVNGIFPAFWLLPEYLLNGRGWPYNGEMDVFEFLSDWNYTMDGITQYRSPSTFHFGSHFSKTGVQFQSPPRYNAEKYHVYAIDWQPDRIIALRDGEIIGVYEKPMSAIENDWPFDYPFHLICNMAIQPGEGSAADSASENQFLAIDWIRVSQSNRE
jgi:beta-glucanase (GH16 family)